ncbi:putative lipid II flippase FtsW [Chlamydiota bacterium]
MNKSQMLFFVCIVLLIGFGLIMIYSASAIYAQEKMSDSYFFLKRQIMWVLVSTILFIITMNIPYTFWMKIARPLMLLAICSLIIIFVPGIGREAGGAKRWIRIGFIGFQPSEFAKLAIVIYLAAFLSRNQARIKHFFKGFIPPLCVLGICLGLIILQPDLGTCIAIGAISFLMFFIAGVKISHLLPLFLASLPLLYIFIFNVTYRRNRILAFLDPWKDPKGTGFQLIQSFIALGSGGTTGVGLGQSRQKLFYLPEAHTDFIFSIIGEELGFLFSAFIIILFVIVVVIGFLVVLRAPDLFSMLTTFGIIITISLQSLINIGVVTGSIPTKGLPLPFISFGGSSLVFTMIGMGIIFNISMQKPTRRRFFLKKAKRLEKTPRRL